MDRRTVDMSEERSRDLMLFGIVMAILIVAAHAVAYLTHEYGHSVTAWALGWMANPLALDYGHATLSNILFLGDVSDNVSYDPIFASGHGVQAAMIALAGVVIGNVGLYFAAYSLAKRPWVADHPTRLAPLFCLALMCAGNVWSYVPIRALTTHADIALAARGFGVSPGLQFPFLLAPALFVVWHFFRHMCARSFAGIAGHSSAKTVLLVAVTSYWFFIFFVGDAAGGDYGTVSLVMALTSKYLLFPLATMALWQRYRPRA